MIFDKSQKRIMNNGDTVILTNPIVMESAAGYYVGRCCKTIESKDGKGIECVEPFDRLSDYYGTKVEAQKHIKPNKPSLSFCQCETCKKINEDIRIPFGGNNPLQHRGRSANPTLKERKKNAIYCVDLENGKYTVLMEGSRLHALRHGEEWRDLCGDNLVLFLMIELQEAREKLETIKNLSEDAFMGGSYKKIIKIAKILEKKE